MEYDKIKQMRRRQIFAINIIILGTLSLFIAGLSLFELTLSGMSLIIALLLASQVLIKLFKNKTSSWLTVFEEVANYEREKMGKEWERQYYSQLILQTVLSGWMFLQAYFTHDDTDLAIQTDWSFITVLMLILLPLVNVELWYRNRKIDRSDAIQDLKGYTNKSLIAGIIVGLIMAFIIITTILLFI